MQKTRLIITYLLTTVLAAAATAGCSFFKNAEKSMENIEKISEKAAKEVEGKGKGPEKPQPEAKHEPVLVDNKVIALRVQAALKKEGAEFDKIEVDATKTEIVMTGTVSSTKARERAEEIARREHAHVKIKNEIKVGK